MLTLLALATAGEGSPSDGVAPQRAVLAAAVRDYHDGREEQAALRLEGLLAERPQEDDAAYWLGRIALETGDCERARELVHGRSGRGQPAWRFRAVEGLAMAVCGQRQEGLELLLQSLASAGRDPERHVLEAAAGLLAVDGGDEAGGAELLVAAGGDPAQVLPAALASALPGAGELLAVEVLAPARGALTVRQSGLDWRLDLSTGLLRREVIQPEAPSSWEGWDDGSPAVRSQARRCGEHWLWISPAEPMSSGEAGVFLAGRYGQVERLERTPDVATDDSPFCAGEVVGWVRRIGGTSRVILLRAGERETLDPGAPVATADARAAPGGPELVLGVIQDGQPAVWWLPPGREPRPLVSGMALTAPRWSD